MSLSNPQAERPQGASSPLVAPTTQPPTIQDRLAMAASPTVRLGVIPLLVSVMEAQVATLVALFVLLALGVDVLLAPLTLFAFTTIMAICLWSSLAFEQWVATWRSNLRDFSRVLVSVVWFACVALLFLLQITAFVPADPARGTFVETFVTAAAFTWFLIRARQFATLSQRHADRSHRWLLTSFKWELAVIVTLLLLASILTLHTTFYTTTLVALPLFIASGLLAISLTRMIALRSEPAFAQTNAQGGEPPQQWYRFFSVFGLVALCLIVVIDLLFLLGVFNLLAPLGATLAGGIGHLFSAFGSWLSHLNSPPTNQPHTGQPTTQPGTTTTSPGSSSGASSSPPTLNLNLSALVIGAIIIGLALAALLIWAFLRRVAQDGPAALRSALRWLMFALLALAGLLALILLLSLIFVRSQSSSTAHVFGIGIQLPFQLPSWLSRFLGVTTQPTQTTQPGGTTTTHPGSTSHPPTNTPLGWLLFALYALAALGILAAIVFLIVMATIAIRRYLRWRRAQRAALAVTTANPSLASSPVVPTGDPARIYYRQLLQAAATVGGVYARRANETPVEYARRLQGLLAQPDAPLALQQAAQGVRNQPPNPAEQAETNHALDDLTGAYRIARYRGDATDATRASTLRQRLSRLLAALRQG